MKPIDMLIKCKHCKKWENSVGDIGWFCELAGLTDHDIYQVTTDCCTAKDWINDCPYLGRDDKDIRTGKRT